jgi:cation diffusion facilitator CzcD-associated flavoprotein CzcO
MWNELHNYIEKVADQFNIVPNIKFGMSWEGSVWIPESSCWRVMLRDCTTGNIFTQMCKVLISATGHLVDPKQLEVRGKSIFKGKIVHSSQWTSDIDVTGKSVVVLGNGSKSSPCLSQQRLLTGGRHCCSVGSWYLGLCERMYTDPASE